jgi:hypothetical protein
MKTTASTTTEAELPSVRSEPLLAFMVRLYNQGYKAGHHDTVEGGYVDIFDCDMSTYHDDVVREIITDANASLTLAGKEG